MGRVAEQVRQFARDVERDIDLVAKASLKDIAEIASTPVSLGGRMPVDTGRLRDSICVTTENGAGEGVDVIGEIIDRAPANSPMTIAWGAPYAAPVEFGSRGTAGRVFARSAVAHYPSIVAANARRIR